MVLAIDIGNSNIVFGVYDSDKAVFSSRIRTDPLRTDMEHAVVLSNILKLNKIEAKDLSGAAYPLSFQTLPLL